ncbi:hypothetical protein GPALN_012011 [Globodera pallida]|nr:hypothetical protein GPALN_012011 [Globodera pallida]
MEATMYFVGWTSFIKCHFCESGTAEESKLLITTMFEKLIFVPRNEATGPAKANSRTFRKIKICRIYSISKVQEDSSCKPSLSILFTICFHKFIQIVVIKTKIKIAFS